MSATVFIAGDGNGSKGTAKNGWQVIGNALLTRLGQALVASLDTKN